MTQGELEKLALPLQRIFSSLEIRIMMDIVRRIRENGSLTATADWQIDRLRQLGKSEEEVRAWVQEALQASEEEIERIFSDEVYEQYYGHERAYAQQGVEQIPLEQNEPLQQLIEASKQQIAGEYQNLAGSMGFAVRDPSGKVQYSPLMDFYRSTIDNAVLDIHSGAFSYSTVLNRTIRQMTDSGLRWIDYDSGWHNRVDVAARRAVMTGFRQVQGKINEQVAAELGTDMYEVTYHVGARPSHQPWQGRVWSMEQLKRVCGLGTGPGLHGWNCYHDYNAFPTGSVRAYTDEQLERMLKEENTPKEYNGREYTTYEALQQQRRMETQMRATRQQIRLLQEGGVEEQEIILRKARYQGQMQAYRDFSKKMGLPEQTDRVYQDGLRGRFMPTKTELREVEKPVVKTPDSGIMRLPRYEKAVLPEAKFNGYALNPLKAPDKARAFSEALGYDLSNGDDLIRNIREHLSEFAAVEKPDNGHGKRYQVVMELTGPNGKTANVLTAWIDDAETGEMRLTTAYVDKRRRKRENRNV